jgi:hypothetical protein
LREERRLRVFKNGVLREIFGAKRDEVTEEWRKLHSEELNYLYCSSSIVWVDGRIILRWFFRKWNVGVWNGSSWLRIATVGGHLGMRY